MRANAFCRIVATRLRFFLRKLLRLSGTKRALLLDGATENAKFFVELIKIALPGRPLGVDSFEELIGQRFLHLTGEVGTLKLLENDVQQVEIGVAVMK